MLNSRMILKIVLLLVILSIQNTNGTQKKNVVFIVADDMRAQIGAYLGPNYPSDVDQQIKTPNLDALASKSLVLSRAYVQQAICAPSRASFMTSRRPDTTKVQDLVTDFRTTGNFTTLPQYFKENGYRTFGIGKLTHGSFPFRVLTEDPISWTEPYFTPPNLARGKARDFSWRAIPPSDIEMYGPLPDEESKDHAIQILNEVAEEAKTGNQPFFLGLGFLLPHLPFLFPQKFLDFYSRDNISLPSNHHIPENMPDIAWFGWGNPFSHPQPGEFSLYEDHRNINLSTEIGATYHDDRVIDMRRAYYCAISYIDELIGEVIAELEKLGLEQNTAIYFFGDHGFSLGENAEWGKSTNFEQSTHAPMMLHIPGVTNRGINTNALVEFVDVYPTLVEAAGLGAMPLCPENSASIPFCTEGMSMMPLVKNNPGLWKEAAFSQYPRNGSTGYSIRTDRYRYTEWPAWLNAQPGDEFSIVSTMNKFFDPDWENLLGVELYDHENDPLENFNQADDPVNAALRQELSLRLHLGWREALPGQACYSCVSSTSHDECNLQTELCGDDEQCMTEVQVTWPQGQYMTHITKGCKPKTMCLTRSGKCIGSEGNLKCWNCCNGYLCDGNMPEL